VDSRIPREDAHDKNGPPDRESESARGKPSSFFQSRVNNRRTFLVNTATKVVPTSAPSKEAIPCREPVPPHSEAVASASSNLPAVHDMGGELLAAVAARSLPAATPLATSRAAGAEARHDAVPKSQRIDETLSEPRNLRDPAATRSAKRATADRRPQDGGRLKTDRRESFRYETPGIQILVSWPDSAGILLQAQSHSGRPGRNEPPVFGRMVRHYALLLSFSQTGLRILIDYLPPQDRQLWVGIDESKHGIWSPVLLRSLDPAEDGRYAVRLSFVDACPYDLFKHAVLRPMSDREAVAFRNGQNQG
jgi:hypothetical protein